MNLFDATLDLAAFAKGTEDYTVSSVSGNEITCEDLSGRVAEFGGGTIWVRTGASAGQFGKIVSNGGQSLILKDSYDLEPGDEITIGAWLEFDAQKLINAVNSVLRTYRIMKVNQDLVYDPDTEYYDLPDGVTEDIRQVEIPQRWTGRQTVSHYWRVLNGQLDLYDKNRLRYMKDALIKIYYAAPHGAVGKDDVISNQVDPTYLRYMSWLYLCRNLIQQTHKDNLVSSDMYNEAKVYERDYTHLPNRSLSMKTFTFPQW